MKHKAAPSPSPVMKGLQTETREEGLSGYQDKDNQSVERDATVLLQGWGGGNLSSLKGDLATLLKCK